jgi:hypothetical protein
MKQWCCDVSIGKVNVCWMMLLARIESLQQTGQLRRERLDEAETSHSWQQRSDVACRSSHVPQT